MLARARNADAGVPCSGDHLLTQERAEVAVPRGGSRIKGQFQNAGDRRLIVGSGILAAKTAQTRVVTVAMEGMSFLEPVRVGDTVACYGWVEKIGRTSMTIPVEVWVQRYMSGEQVRVTQGVFVYVAVDASGKPIPVRREA